MIKMEKWPWPDQTKAKYNESKNEEQKEDMNTIPISSHLDETKAKHNANKEHSEADHRSYFWWDSWERGVRCDFWYFYERPIYNALRF